VSHLFASMGPRPRGRGNKALLDLFKRSGIASMGPRPRGRGNMFDVAMTPPNSWLQWGRDRAVAEISLVMLRPSNTPKLQWGRDRAVAEIQRALELRHVLAVLQWGRDRAVAEMGHAQRTGAQR